MGASGNHSKYNYNYGAYSSAGYAFTYFRTLFSYNETVDPVNNLSKIDLSVYIFHDSLSIGSRVVNVYWNDVLKTSFNGNAITNWSTGQTDLIGTTSFEVEHDNAGDAQGVIKVEWITTGLVYAGKSIYESGACTDLVVLTNIPKVPPTINNVTLTNSKFVNRVVAGYSESTIEIDAAADIGSIVRYTVSENDITLIDSSESIIHLMVPNIQDETKDFTYVITVYDSNGLSASVTLDSFTAYKYTQGQITNTVVQRCLANGSLEDEGTFAKCQAVFINSKLGVDYIETVCTITIVGVSDASDSSNESPMVSVLGNGNVLTNYSYDVAFVLADGVSEYTEKDRISVAFVMLDAVHGMEGGGGVGVGCNASEGYLDIKNLILRIEGKKLIEYVYPVGSIFMSTNNTDPASLFGGSWQYVGNEDVLTINVFIWKRIS